MNGRTLFFSVFLIVPSFAAGQEIRFTDAKYNFGFVREGDTVNMEFSFLNVGTEPLMIGSYTVECSCTVMESHTKAVLPGESSGIKISFDTTNKSDRQDRTVTIISNAINSPSELRFKGVVLKKKGK